MNVVVPNMNMVSCGSSDCENGTHSFNVRQFKRVSEKVGRQFLEQGVCKACGANPIDWERLHRRRLDDVDYTFASLRKETIRAEFWNRKLSKRVKAEAMALGVDGVLEQVGPRLWEILGHEETGYWDHLRVPIKDEKIRSVVQYAQHAVASCCRVCTNQWHGIPKSGSLTNSHFAYLIGITSAYVRTRLQAA